jgi:collagenase-like PrtC family protease
MKFAVGFQFLDAGGLFCEMLADYRAAVGEVYFAWPGTASGRPDPGGDPELIGQLLYELGEIKRSGIALDLLLNANCYGGGAVSDKLERRTVEIISALGKADVMPAIVTTTSPFVAASVKKHFPEMELRASVNMRLDSTLALEFLADKFDSFYIRRDLQRDLATLRDFHEWCRAHGKKLGLLANSGCLRNCPYQTFHDNLVAHDAEVRECENVRDFLPHLCWERYRKRENWSDFLRGSWIRPEDIATYAPHVDFIKLATRQHASPRLVIAAYAAGRFDGNVLDLTEPCFSGAFAPYILDNTKLAADYLPGRCATNCRHCGKCEKVLEKALRPLPDLS